MLVCALFVSVSMGCAQEAKPAAPPAVEPTAPKVSAAAVPAAPIVPTTEAVMAWNGVWTPQGCEFDGQQQLNGESKNSIRLSVVGTEYRMYLILDAKEMTGRRLSTADLSVDDKAGTFEMTIKDGYKKGERVHGIYAIKDDTLKVCYCPTGKPRPKEFAAPKGSEVFNEVWTRANIKK
jgi:uncharacterized protein (TIGR03067 family)